MRYHISGTDRRTGQLIKMEIDAITFESAMQMASQKGVVVRSCQGAGEGAIATTASMPVGVVLPLKDDPTALTLIIVGEVCAVISLLFCPILFALAALVMSIILMTRGRIGWGIAIMAQSVFFGLIGMIFGALVAIDSL